MIVGDPARVDKAAKYLDDVSEWAFNREYKSILGTYRGKRILVMSTGIGAPSAGIGVEELHNVNVKKVIRVGSAGAMQSGIGFGELIIGEGVVRDDGLTQKQGGGKVLVVSSGMSINEYLSTMSDKYKGKPLQNAAVTKLVYKNGKLHVDGPIGTLHYVNKGQKIADNK